MKSTFLRTIAFCICFFCLIFYATANTTMLHHLRCEYLANPLGIDAVHPRLSWIMQSPERGQKQTAYQILVAGSLDNLQQDIGDLWDSGKVVSDQSIHIHYQGRALSSHTQCYWKVRVWDKSNQPTAWSDTATWSMGLLSPSDWKAQWIGLDKGNPETTDTQFDEIQQAKWIWSHIDNPAESAPVGTVYFRKTIHIANPLAKAEAYLTADNGFTLWVNGDRVGQGNHFKTIFRFDLMPLLHTGANTICVSANNGGDEDNPAGLIGGLHLVDQNNKKTVILTNDTWKVSPQEHDQWNHPTFDDSMWKQAYRIGNWGIAPWGEINATAAEDILRRLPARYVRKEFSINKTIEHAMAYVCGLGLFELHINGAKISDYVLKPGLTEYEDRVFYETFSITEQLRTGKNAVGVILGNGRYYAPRLKIPTETKTYGYPKLLLQMHVQYTDGTSEVIVSDPSWKITDQGPIRANNEYDGEEYDARMEIPGWSRHGFNETSWQTVERVQAPDGALRSPMLPPIRVTQTLNPISVTEPKPGVFIFDLGQNMVGWCKLKVRGEKGQTVTLRHAEVLNEDGTLYLANIRSANVTDKYTLHGHGWETWEPRFTYHGFRYVEVTGYPGKPDLSAIEGKVVHDDLEPAGSFSCSNALLNQIDKNIFWGVRGNYRSFPTDCPQRDERQAWLGDRAAEAKGESYIYNVAPLYVKWMIDIKDAQQESGSIPSVAPTYWPMNPNDVTWPSAFTIIHDGLYVQYGELRAIEEHYPAMKKWITFMSQFLEDNIMPRDTYGDWCVPPESKELIHSQDPKRKTAKAVLGTTYFYKNLCLMAQYATLLGKSDESRAFQNQADAIKKAFNDKFFDAANAQYDNGSQTSFVLPLAFGMVPSEHKTKVFNRLVNKIITETNGHIGTGLIGGQWLMRVLSDNGRPDIAYTIATQTAYPSWGYMIEQGATTIWELWNGNTADPAMNSGNHVMLIGDLKIWMTEYLAGIQPDPTRPAFKHIIMKPTPVGDLQTCRGEYQSIYGKIVSDWAIQDQQFNWKIEIPANTTATLYIPAASSDSIQESGTPAKKAEGLAFQNMENGTAVFTAQSGQYEFVSTRQ
jgi:alpha-L-rhamnosidase